jgi:FdhE protein
LAQTILQPEQIAALPPADFALVVPPDRGLFAARAQRLDRLAGGHAMEGYLRFVAAIACAQDAALAAGGVSRSPLPDERALALAADHGMPPVAVSSWQRDPSWRDALAVIAAHVVEAPVPDAARKQGTRLQAADPAWLEDQAGRVLTGASVGLDRGAAVFIAAALQVYWVDLAVRLGTERLRENDVKTVCPCCGSPPVASVRRAASEAGRRYLACSLCGTQWNYPRVTCAHCESDKGLAYYAVETAYPWARAETCTECGTYLKLLMLDKAADLEPVADDLATLGLDLALDEQAKFQRAAVNLMLFPGEDA